MNIEDQHKFYDERWSEFEFANRFRLGRAAIILQMLYRCRFEHPPAIIDLGCGAGWMTGILSNFGPTLGIELSNKAVARARERYPTANFDSADILNMDYEAGTFDVVVSQEVLEHFENHDEYIRIASELLSSRGFLILTTPNAKHYRTMNKINGTPFGEQPIENPVSIEELRRLIAPYFTIIDITTINPLFSYNFRTRLLTSVRVNRFMKTINLEWVFEEIKSRSGIGKNIVLLAQKVS